MYHTYDPFDVQPAGSGGPATVTQPAVAVAGSTPPTRLPISGRVACLAHLTSLHKDVLGLSDALQAVTITANGNMLRSAERQGVSLEAVLHHAVWLTGQ